MFFHSKLGEVSETRYVPTDLRIPCRGASYSALEGGGGVNVASKDEDKVLELGEFPDKGDI